MRSGNVDNRHNRGGGYGGHSLSPNLPSSRKSALSNIGKNAPRPIPVTALLLRSTTTSSLSSEKTSASPSSSLTSPLLSPNVEESIIIAQPSGTWKIKEIDNASNNNSNILKKKEPVFPQRKVPLLAPELEIKRKEKEAEEEAVEGKKSKTRLIDRMDEFPALPSKKEEKKENEGGLLTVLTVEKQVNEYVNNGRRGSLKLDDFLDESWLDDDEDFIDYSQNLFDDEEEEGEGEEEREGNGLPSCSELGLEREFEEKLRIMTKSVIEEEESIVVERGSSSLNEGTGHIITSHQSRFQAPPAPILDQNIWSRQRDNNPQLHPHPPHPNFNEEERLPPPGPFKILPRPVIHGTRNYSVVTDREIERSRQFDVDAGYNHLIHEEEREREEQRRPLYRSYHNDHGQGMNYHHQRPPYHPHQQPHPGYRQDYRPHRQYPREEYHHRPIDHHQQHRPIDHQQQPHHNYHGRNYPGQDRNNYHSNQHNQHGQHQIHPQSRSQYHSTAHNDQRIQVQPRPLPNPEPIINPERQVKQEQHQLPQQPPISNPTGNVRRQYSTASKTLRKD